jgi:two-component system, OmpR family, response regulator TctD
MGARVLLVEDEPALAHLLQRFLTRAGFAPVACGTATEALALWNEGYAVAVVDLGLPDLSGERLVAELLSRVRDRPIVISSGTPAERPALGLSGDSDDLRRVHFLQKPYLPGQLIELLARLGVAG